MARKLALRHASPAALDLRRFWIERLEYEEADESGGELPDAAIRVSRPEILEAGEGEYLVTLRLRLTQGEVRAIDLTIAGDFRLRAGDDADPGGHPPLRVLAYNGTAILFSAARGVIEAVTGLSGYGRMHVPAVNVAELLSR